MKENELLRMRRDLDTLGAVVQKIMQDNQNLKDLAIGTLELVKQLPDYESAVEKLKQNYLDESLKREAEEKAKNGKLET
jgi:biotin synthase-related radical SAM superfamily protein